MQWVFVGQKAAKLQTVKVRGKLSPECYGNKTEKTVSKGCADRTEILIEHDKTTKKNAMTDKTGKNWKRQNKQRITSLNKFEQVWTS